MTSKSIIEVICENLHMSAKELFLITINAPDSYKTYTIPKRSGGKRTIAQPTAEIKEIQRCIVRCILEKLPTSDIGTAYKQGVSIKENAEKHLGMKYLLKMDFKDFFPSIQPVDLVNYFHRNSIKLSSNEIKYLTLLLFRRNKNNTFELSIGAPSSPIISNIVMQEFDIKVDEFCKKNSVSFTRYADDLTFSSNELTIIKKIPPFIDECISTIQSPKLTINKDKTHLISKGRSQRVTGIILTHKNTVSIGRSLRKKIRALLHLYYTKKLNVDTIPYLHGIISHARHIEPDFYGKLVHMYGNELFKELADITFSTSKK